jgi:F-type H+-transporting ATPase subunit a
MASDVLHLKDSIYFEVPRALWRSNKTSITDFPNWWVRLDPDFQSQEADRLIAELKGLGAADPQILDGLKEQWLHWQHDNHANFGRPLDMFLEMQAAQLDRDAARWRRASKDTKQLEGDELVRTYISSQKPTFGWFRTFQDTRPADWLTAKRNADNLESYRQTAQWSPEKIEAYNRALDGKVMIPQPFGEPRNAYERESGFLLTKYFLLQLLVAALLIWFFSRLAQRVRSGDVPRGKGWNLLEGALQFVRERIAVPAIGEHDADRFVPLLWTMFLFILGCNLLGMIPWLGAPTSALDLTFVLAAIVFGVGVVCGVRAFGPLGYLKNQVPHMDLPWYFSIILVPLIWAIEMFGLLIKHLVLAVRLLANMLAGHLVMLGLLGIAFAADRIIDRWWFASAGISIGAVTLFSLLELFVAFLQAYVFTFLAALFIGSAIHHH